ncbi:DUF5947 family protein [Streptomyces sp. DH37]|uniref:DUF5947 family protein n=1 Tax=Streptomyces sp. DH37 TaxID=3040122 RepID=UPI0024436796|nr:DUF5947 family protein [Streptomyces sp. DH37]MDG9703195.1 DUF5947 family protein [Streptomyces sp. DH37]
MTAPLATPRLRRPARRPGEERCDLRSEPLPGGHRHLPDARAGAASRAHRACSPPSDRKEAGGVHHRLPPRSTVDADRRPAVGTCAPAVAATADDVEALLVNRANDAREQWTVPLDDCRLPAAAARTHRKGPGGGSEVRGHVGDFLRGLRADPSTADPTAAGPTVADPPAAGPHRLPTRHVKEASWLVPPQAGPR